MLAIHVWRTASGDLYGGFSPSQMHGHAVIALGNDMNRTHACIHASPHPVPINRMEYTQGAIFHHCISDEFSLAVLRNYYFNLLYKSYFAFYFKF